MKSSTSHKSKGPVPPPAPALPVPYKPTPIDELGGPEYIGMRTRLLSEPEFTEIGDLIKEERTQFDLISPLLSELYGNLHLGIKDYIDAMRWFWSPSDSLRRSGRSTTMSKVAIDIALQHPGRKVYLQAHSHSYNGDRYSIVNHEAQAIVKRELERLGPSLKKAGIEIEVGRDYIAAHQKKRVRNARAGVKPRNR